MQHIKDALREWGYDVETGPDLTKQARRRIESVEGARMAVGDSHHQLAFHARPFVLCGLPVRALPLAKFVTPDRMESSRSTWWGIQTTDSRSARICGWQRRP